jgi:hypothetical protein
MDMTEVKLYRDGNFLIDLGKTKSRHTTFVVKRLFDHALGYAIYPHSVINQFGFEFDGRWFLDTEISISELEKKQPFSPKAKEWI